MMLQSTAMSRGFFGSLRFARPLAVLLLAVTLVASSGAPGDAHAEGRGGLVNASAEAMIEAARARGMASAASSEVLASLAVIGALDDDAAPTKAAEALVALEQNSLVSKDLRDEISLMSLRVAPPSKARDERTLAMGIAPVWVIGPFRDTGGGLLRKEGPEEAGQSFFDKRAQYNYGAYDVHWREVPPSYAAARGIPLDLFVHPRKESCSIVASPVTVTAPGGVRLSVASSGQARLMWDRTEVAHSEDVHKGNTFDRLAGRVTATPGDHVVWVKTCSGAIADDGRVRLRVVADGAVMGAAKGAPLAATGKAQVAAARTPLADALDSKGDKLSQATVRALGASDDLRSPRAQGLIDAALQGKDDSDRLALAGWISPSAANRTGLLERARKAATRDNDTRVRGFVDRELAVESVRAGLGDWALAELERIRKIPGYQESTRDLALYLDAVASTGNEAGRIEAFRKLRAAFEKSPQTTPTVALAMVSRVAPSFDVNVAVAAEKELARRGYLGAHLVALVAQVDVKNTPALAVDSFDGFLDSAAEGQAIVSTLVNIGAYPEAARLAQALAQWSPNRAEIWATLAYALERATNKSDGALQALRISAQLEPTAIGYRRALAARVAPRTESARPEDEKYIVPSEAILARRLGVPKGMTDVADRELYWLRAVTMHSDARVSQIIHYAREIVVPPTTQSELEENVPREGDATEILRARVHRRDGGIAYPTAERNDRGRPQLVWPQLNAGDTVEVALRTWTTTQVGGRGDAPFYFLDYAGAPVTHPLIYNEVVVENEPGKSLYVDVIHGTNHKHTVADENGKHIERFVWEKPDSIPDEPLAPPLSEVVPVIVGSTYKSWADFRAWYTEAVRGFTEPDDQVRRLSAELTKGKRTREEKLAALFEFVADNIRYVNYVSGEWWLPNRPQQLLARREGDCDDKAILLISLLKAAGIDAEEVLVQTRLTGQPSVLRAKNAAIPLFDHGIAYLPGLNGQPGQYLDATSPQSRLGPLPSMDAYASALRVTGKPEIVEMPAASALDHGSDVKWTVKLRADGGAEIVGDEMHTGDSAFYLRNYLESQESRTQFVEDSLVEPWAPSVTVDKKVEFKGNLRNGQAQVGYKATSEGLARRDQNDMLVPLGGASTLASTLAPLVKRVLPVQLPPHLAPSHQTRTVRFTAPAGYTWADPPEGGEVRGGTFGDARLDVKRISPTIIEMHRTLVFKDHRIAPEQYGAWRNFLLSVDGLMHRSVRLVHQ